MSELREDYVLDRWVIISEKRAKRPDQLKKKKTKPKKKICFFCPDNEHLTPYEKGSVDKDGHWVIRWFDNKFAAVDEKGQPTLKHKGIYNYAHAFGDHEVIVDTEKHDKQLWDMSPHHIAKLLNVYSERINELGKVKGVKYVAVFKNHGLKGGASVAHSHSQIISLNRVPTLLKTKAKKSFKWGKCIYCDVIKREQRSKRLIKNSDNFLTFAPYASRFNYEAWIFPKKHLKNITEFEQKDFLECARHIKNVIYKLKKIDASYNMFLHYAPRGTKMHFHIEITPRIATHAGFEISTGTIIDMVSPESAAVFYRAK